MIQTKQIEKQKTLIIRGIPQETKYKLKLKAATLGITQQQMILAVLTEFVKEGEK